MRATLGLAVPIACSPLWGAVLGQKDCISEQLRRYIAGVVRWNPEPKFLADLTRGHRLYGHCAKCGRTKVLDVNKLEQRFGPFFTLDEVRARVRCTKCKRRTNELRLVSERR